jgi:hypothetical protein
MRLAQDAPRTEPHALDRQSLLFGRDDTPGIVSITADRHGRARVWRRVNGTVVYEEDHYPNWFFLARRDLLGDLPAVDLPLSALESKPEVPPEGIGVVRLRGDNPLRYLVLTDRLDDVEQYVVEAARRAQEAGTLVQPLSELLYIRPVLEQYLTITGRTYFKGMSYGDVRRLQFDLETTGLGIDQDSIFMVSIKDSAGFAAVLDIGSMDEAELLRRLVRIIRDRDPDVIENHNIFDFDIRFLIKRARALDVHCRWDATTRNSGRAATASRSARPITPSTALALPAARSSTPSRPPVASARSSAICAAMV